MRINRHGNGATASKLAGRLHELQKKRTPERRIAQLGHSVISVGLRFVD
jgi:hypothetical protein